MTTPKPRIAAGLLALLLAVPAAQAVQNIDRRLPTGAAPAVEVSIVQGRVNVVGWDRQEVHVSGVIENDKHRFEMSGDERHVVIKVRAENRNFGGGRNSDANLEIRVPRAAALEVQTVSADIGVDAVSGALKLESVSGRVVATVFDEQLDLRTISGDAEVRGSGGAAAVYAETTSGNLTARGLGGGVEARSVSGDLDLQIGTTPKLRAETVSGDMVATLSLAEGGRVDAESVSGDVRLTLARPLNAEFDIESFSGDIESCFGAKATRKSQYAPGSVLRSTEGEARSRVSIDTLSGDIRICDR